MQAPCPPRSFEAAGRTYSPSSPLIIAETGTSHGGDISKAREMIDAAREAGASCVKFQMVYADEILHPNTGLVALPGGNIRLYDRFKALEMPPDFYGDLKEYTEKQGLLFLCTPFGPRSLRELRVLGPGLMKIASPELNYYSLLEGAADCGVPLLLSTGVSKLKDIEAALETLDGRLPCCLLHCVTSYPAPEGDYNLRLLPLLSGIFGLSVGISDHSLDPSLVPVLALTQGAVVIEKHFCLSREDPGLDDPIALPPEDFSRMVGDIRRYGELLGDDQAGRERVLLLAEEVWGREKVEAVLGDGVKRLARSEGANYERTNRSIHALRDIAAGEIIQRDMFSPLRTEKVLRPGLGPEWEEALVGRRARKPIPAGEGIRWEDV